MVTSDVLVPRAIGRDSDEYPELLRDLEEPPSPLWVLGDISVVAPPAVAIVGTRASTPYGERVARDIATAVARAGGCVISGMARGIDAVAHRAALAAGGRTCAVLGTGVDVPYPVGHRDLHREIARRGVVLSEFDPGAHAMKGAFPRRNRIIAALAKVTIVVEAPSRSGALLTADRAQELSRAVAAVPGPIDSPQSKGSNFLLREGAQPITCVDDALALASLTRTIERRESEFSEDERAVWRALSRGPLDLDSLTSRSGLPARRCMTAVTSLELAGALECALTGEVRRR